MNGEREETKRKNEYSKDYFFITNKKRKRKVRICKMVKYSNKRQKWASKSATRFPLN